MGDTSGGSGREWDGGKSRVINMSPEQEQFLRDRNQFRNTSFLV